MTDRIARIVTVVASVWFAFTAGWGMFGIPGSGHLGAGSAGNFMAAEQIVRWKILYPAWEWYTGVEPPKSAYLCHHPFGQYYIPALLIWILGHHDFVVRLPAVLMSAAIPPLLYGIAKERWGAPLGAVAAAAYAVVPIAVGFSSFWNLETICIFGALLFFWGHSRHTTTSRRRYLIASLVGLGFACSGDWVGYLLVAPTLAWSFLRAFVLPAGFTPRLRLAPYARWWALSAAMFGGTLLLWVALFNHADQILDWLSSGDLRGGGEGLKLDAILESRKYWIDFSFTPLAIKLGKIAAPICLLRLLVTRLDEETYAPGLLFGAVIQYVLFQEGADIHIFWPHYFAPYFALAMAQLAGAIAAAIGWIVRRFAPSRAAAVAAVAGLAVGLMPTLAMAHDGVKSLWVWRRTGGRYDDNGTDLRSQVDMLFVVAKVIKSRKSPGMLVDTHPSAAFGWEQQWTYEGNARLVGAPSVGSPALAAHPFWIARGSGLLSDDQRRISASAHVRIFGDIWVVDQREPEAPLDAYSLNEREPNAWEWLVFGGTEPTRSIGARPDPWLTWEWRVHLGQNAEPPVGEPITLDQMRIAHNMAIDRGDQAGAQRWRARIETKLDRSVATPFDQALRLIGVRVTQGVQPRVESWFECGAPIPTEGFFQVRSTVEARAAWSLIPPDLTDREMAWPTSLPTRLWRAHWLYVAEAVLNHRIGVERYWGYWTPRDVGIPPRRADGQAETTLAILP